VLDSGLEISGQVADLLEESSGAVSFVKWTGPVQLCRHGSQISSQGRERHSSGFSGPLGRWKRAAERPAHQLTNADLKRFAIEVGKKTELELSTGFVIKGRVLGFHRDPEGSLLFVTFGDCSVTRQGKTYFEPEWGEFDLAVGEKIVSVYGGPADMQSFGEIDIGKATTAPARTTPFTATEQDTFVAYRRARELREQSKVTELEGELSRLADAVLQRFDREWLLQLELLEIALQRLEKPIPSLPWAKRLESRLLETAKTSDPVTRQLVSDGLALLSVSDKN
jgi:phenylalanine-4-hydroxylase